ncbi:hypothetical protein BXY41_10451 [Lacrimispora xylanisolvens]|uniref:Uncharacterized protein n=1 Tax=Lacrimispora xylanisolvens TaxID=384636 RepID=A0A2S6HU27_9FIRM|nr:hypothetical protein [Hungatella xylanolytica]PPK81252.1 hypothetical protein BXY41_10451 [Hungatella xylanolytica]
MEINIPIKMIGDLTQEDLNKKCKEKVDQPLDAYLVGTDGYPNCINVTFNDNYTDFEITTKSTELDLAESLSIKGYYRTGEDYNYYNDTPFNNVHVKFINADTGEMISDTNSKDMKE